MADLELLFSTRGELEGARQYAAELERTIGKMKAAGKDASELTEKLGKLNVSIGESEKGLKSEGDQQDRTAQSTERLTGSKSRLREAMRGLAVEFPLLARMMGFMANPLSLVTAGFALATGAVHQWVQSIREASRLQAEGEAIRMTVTSIARLREEIESSNTLEAQSKDLHEWALAAQAAAKGAKALNDELERKRRNDDALAQERAEALRAEVRAKGLRPGEEAAALAQIDTDLARGAAGREVDTEHGKLTNLLNALKSIDEVIGKLAQGGLDAGVLAEAKQQAEIAEREAGAAADRWKKASVNLPEKIRSLEADAALQESTGTIPFWQRYQMKVPFRDRDNQSFSFDPRFLVSNPNDIVASRLSDARHGLRQSEFEAEDRASQADEARRRVERMTAAEAQRKASLSSAQGLRESLLGEVESSRSAVESRTLFHQQSLPLGQRRREADTSRAFGEQAEQQSREHKQWLQRELQQLTRGTADAERDFAAGLQAIYGKMEKDSRELTELKRKIAILESRQKAVR